MTPYKFNVVPSKVKRVIIDTDTKNEVDDQFAVLHALMTPMFDIRGIIATHFGHDRIENSLEASYEELIKVLDYSGFLNKVKAVKGAKTYLKHINSGFLSEISFEETEGSRLIVEEAHACEIGQKLYIGVLGPLTNVATAISLHPEIEEKLIVVWNGGGLYPEGGLEFNLVNDIVAANILMESKVEIWQVPTKVYALPRASLAELQYKVLPHGRIGKFLFEETLLFFKEMEKHKDWPLPESLDICDLTVIALLMEEHKYCYTYESAPFISNDMYYRVNKNNRPIRVYSELDGRYVLEDFFCKLAINYPKPFGGEKC